MRVLGSIVEVSALSVFNTGKRLTPSDAIAPQLVGHDQSRHILQTLQKPPEEALYGLGIASGLNEDVEYDPSLIDGAPEIVLHALDPDEDFVHVRFVSRLWPAAAQAGGKAGRELLAPAPDRLVGDDNTAFCQE